MGLCVGKGFKRYIGSGFLEGFMKKSREVRGKSKSCGLSHIHRSLWDICWGALQHCLLA